MPIPIFSDSAIAYQNDPFCVVSIHDTSIEWPENQKEQMELRDKYLRTRDISLLRFKPGSEPTKFYLRLLNTAQFLHLCSNCMQYDERTQRTQLNEASTAMMFFLACVAKVENLPRKDGTMIGIFQPREQSLSNSELNEYFPGMSVLIQEIGWVSYRRHFLAQGIAKSFV